MITCPRSLSEFPEHMTRVQTTLKITWCLTSPPPQGIPTQLHQTLQWLTLLTCNNSTIKLLLRRLVPRKMHLGKPKYTSYTWNYSMICTCSTSFQTKEITFNFPRTGKDPQGPDSWHTGAKRITHLETPAPLRWLWLRWADRRLSANKPW